MIRDKVLIFEMINYHLKVFDKLVFYILYFDISIISFFSFIFLFFFFFHSFWRLNSRDRGAHHDRIIFIHNLFMLIYVISEEGSKVSRNM